MTPSAEPGAPSTLTSSSTRRWVAEPASRIAPRSTLLSWRSIAQMARACSASGARRSLRMSSVAAFSHVSAALIAATGAVPSSAAAAAAHQDATSAATGAHRSSRRRPRRRPRPTEHGFPA